MDKNGKGMIQEDLDLLPEVEGVVLWQPDEESPERVIDANGIDWRIGFHKGNLSKSRCR